MNTAGCEWYEGTDVCVCCGSTGTRLYLEATAARLHAVCVLAAGGVGPRLSSAAPSHVATQRNTNMSHDDDFPANHGPSLQMAN